MSLTMEITPDVIPNAVDYHLESEEEKLRRPLGKRVRSNVDKRISDALNVPTKDEKKYAADLTKIIYAPRNWARQEGELGVEDPLHASLQAGSGLSLWAYLNSGEAKAIVADPDLSREEKSARLNAEAHRVVSTVEARNNERVYYENKYLPTVGLEVEFPRFKNDLLGDISLGVDEIRDRQIPAREDKISTIASVYVPEGKLADGAFKYQREASPDVGEVIFNPTASPASQLRQVLALMETGMISKELIVTHTNIGGLRLNQHYTEPMTLTAIMAAVDYNQSFYANAKDGPSGEEEIYKKVSDDYSFYPMHRSRKNYRKVVDYKERGTSVVEFRGNCSFDSYPGFVRSVESVYYLSAAAKAKQSIRAGQDEVPDETSIQLAEVWDELDLAFSELLSEYGIGLEIEDSINIGNKKFHQLIPEGGTSDLLSINTPYNTALGHIRYNGQFDEEFRDKSTRLMIRARAKVKKIIKQANQPK